MKKFILFGLVGIMLLSLIPRERTIAKEKYDINIYGKGDYEITSTDSSNILIKVLPKKDYRLWRIVPRDNQYERFGVLQKSENTFSISTNNLNYIDLYFISNSEYIEILKDAGSESNLKYYFDNPKWFFKYGKEVLSSKAYDEVYGELEENKQKLDKDYKRYNIYNNLPKKKMIGVNASYGIPADYNPVVGATFGGKGNAPASNSGKLSDYDVTFTTGYLTGLSTKMQCVEAGMWYPIGERNYVATVTGVNSSNRTFSVNVDVHPDDPKEQICRITNLILEYDATGFIQIIKESANPSITNGNSRYSLEGATYGLFREEACNTKLGSLGTDKTGKTWVGEMPLGSYYIKETSAPKGYLLNSGVHHVILSSSHTKSSPLIVTLKEVPQIGKAKLLKKSANPSITNGNSCYSLEGAVYELYTESDKKVGEFTTDSSGNSNLIELALGKYYVRETKAPKGYAIDETTKTYINITTNKNYTFEVKDEPQDDPVYVALKKLDKETGEKIPLEKGSLEGAEFTYEYYDNYDCEGSPVRTWVYKTDENGEINPYYLENFLSDKSDELYYATDGSIVFPVGSVAIRETKAPKGYQLDNTVYKYVIRSVDEMIVVIAPDGSINAHLDVEIQPIVSEQIKRGDYCFNKVASDTKQPMANVKFKITADETKESHIITTDDNGFWSSQSAYALHSYETNSSKKQTGTWFGSDKDGNLAEVNDNLGAFPFGTYLFEELPSKENLGYDLLVWRVSISTDEYVLQGGTKEDPKRVYGMSSLAHVDNKKEVEKGNQAKLTDIISISNLLPGDTYILKGKLIQKDTKEPLRDRKGNLVESVKEFEADSTNMNIKLSYDINTNQVNSKELVAYDYLYSQVDTSTPIGIHENINDKDQTISIKEISMDTYASSNDSYRVKPTRKVKITDKCSLSGLIIGKEYRIEGKQMIKEDGKELLVGEKLVSSTKEFAATSENMDVEVEYVIDGRPLNNKHLVSFEYLYNKDSNELLAKHTDINAMNQTIFITDQAEVPQTGLDLFLSSIITDNVFIIALGLLMLGGVLLAIILVIIRKGK